MQRMWHRGAGLTIALLLISCSLLQAEDWTPRRKRARITPRTENWSVPKLGRPIARTTANPFQKVVLQRPVVRRTVRRRQIQVRAQNDIVPAMAVGLGQPTTSPVITSAPVATSPVSSDSWWQPSPNNLLGGNAQNMFREPFHSRWEISTEAMLWKLESDDLPAVATFGVNTGMMIPGALGNPTTQIALGGDMGEDPLFGGRVKVGWWRDPNHAFGIEANLFYLDENMESMMVSSPGTPILAVPFINENTNAEDALVIAAPGISGSVIASFRQRMWGAEANFKTNHLIGPNARLDLLAGFRSIGLEEEFQLATRSLNLGTGVLTERMDRFSTRNRFYGGQLGAMAEFRRGCWSVNVSGKAGVGNVRQSINVGGQTNITGQAGVANGFFTQPTNVGIWNRDKIAYMGEVGVTVGYQLTKFLRATVGYNLLFLSNVVRPSGAIDRVIDTTNPAGNSRPQPLFNDGKFWAQGARLGLEFRY